MIAIAFSILLSTSVSVIVTYYWCKRQHRQQSLDLLKASHELTEALEMQLTHMSTKCGELEDRLAQATEDAKKQRGLADLHISKNEQFDKQARDAWQRLREYGLRAGNAQAWLFRELENAVRLVNKYKSEKGEKLVEVNPQLVSMIADMKRELTEQ